MTPNFRFSALFAISDDKQRVWYITRGIYPAFLENRIFLPHFAVLPVFMKYGTEQKRAVEEKNRWVFRLWYEKFHLFQCSFSFLRSNLDFTTKRKKIFFKKVAKFWWFFYFEARYLQIRWSDFDDFFCKLLTISFSLQL